MTIIILYLEQDQFTCTALHLILLRSGSCIFSGEHAFKAFITYTDDERCYAGNGMPSTNPYTVDGYNV